VIAGETLEVIAERSRRQILDELLNGEQSVNALVGRLSMTQPAVSNRWSSSTSGFSRTGKCGAPAWTGSNVISPNLNHRNQRGGSEHE